jgi:hypothetical protein
MPDDNMFIANPSQVQAGGGMTDEVSQLIERAAKAFASATEFDPQDPPWGDDQIGHGFAENYVKPHAQLRDALTSFATAVTNAARLTVESGKNFQKTQDGALEHIRQNGGGRH